MSACLTFEGWPKPWFSGSDDDDDALIGSSLADVIITNGELVLLLACTVPG